MVAVAREFVCLCCAADSGGQAVAVQSLGVSNTEKNSSSFWIGFNYNQIMNFTVIYSMRNALKNIV